MFHMQDQHTQQSIAMQKFIPILTEIALLPLTIKLFKSKKIFTFLASLAANIPLKRLIYKQALNAHTRSQGARADRWMLHKSDNIDDLYAVMQYRIDIIRKGFADLYFEYLKNGYSHCRTFNVIMKLFATSTINTDFDSQRFDNEPEYAEEVYNKMISLYEKLEQQPLKWPLRLLQNAFDPTHPFYLDDIEKI